MECIFAKKETYRETKKIVKTNKVICALSGGVDSSVAALLIHKAIKKKLVCIMVDTGLMRKDEFKITYKIFKKRYNLNVKLINASNIFLKNLKNITLPEKKGKSLVDCLLKYSRGKPKRLRK